MQNSLGKFEGTLRHSMPDVAVPSGSAVREAPLRRFEEIVPEEYAIIYQKTCYPRHPYPDTRIIIEQFVSWFADIGLLDSVLELGCGPVLSHIMTIVPYCKRITMSDYLSANLALISKWISAGSDDWSGHIEYVLLAEGFTPTAEAIKAREEAFRSRLCGLIVGDLRKSNPIGSNMQFSLVMCCYATEQAARDLQDWRVVFSNLANCVAPAGYLVLSLVKNSDYYVIGDGTADIVRIPIIRVDEAELYDAFIENGFDEDSIEIISENCDGLAEQGLAEVILAIAKRH